MTAKKRWLLGIYSLIAGMAVALISFFVPPLYHLFHGLGLFENHAMLKYEASNEANLKALRVALMDYHESEGQFPQAAGWMDAIKNRVKVDNMAQSEADKKFVNPLQPAIPGVFGYALNDAAGGKYKGDLPPKTPLVFDSADTAWNAHGDPAKLKPKKGEVGGDEAITVDGSLVKL